MGISSSKSMNKENSPSNLEEEGIIPKVSLPFKRLKTAAAPLVFSRRGSRYFDKDGDLAHEFYEEVVQGDGERTMRKVSPHHLIPEGNIVYSTPCIHTDSPCIMLQNNNNNNTMNP